VSFGKPGSLRSLGSRSLLKEVAMKISQLIKKLEKVKANHGDLRCVNSQLSMSDHHNIKKVTVYRIVPSTDNDHGWDLIVSIDI
jgi:hypothetical protein